MKIDKLKKDDIVELNIDAYTSEGQGIGRHNGMAVFVPFALKGERIRARIVKTTSSYAIGRLTDIISRSDDRIDPVCKVFGRCGGCNLLHMSYSEQLEFKRQQVQNALERIGGFRGVFVEPCIGMDKHEGYRNKASFPFAYDGGKVVSGYFESKSHRLIPISECRIQNEILIQAKRIVTDWANKFSISVYDERSRKGILRHVVVRETNDGVMVVIVTTGRLPRANELVTMLKEGIPKLKSIIHNTNTSDTSLILGRKSSVIFGYRSIIETLGELKFSVSAESFLQVNRTQTLKLYETAINGLKLSSNDVVIDLYCGIGTISLLMAGRVKFVLGIESVQAAIDNAKENAELNNISNVKFICGEVETLLPKLIDGEGAKTDNGIEFLAFVAKYGTLKESNGVSICTNLKNEYCNENILEGFSARHYNIDYTKHLEAKEIPYRNEEKAWVKRKHPIDALVLDPPRKGRKNPRSMR